MAFRIISDGNKRGPRGQWPPSFWIGPQLFGDGATVAPIFWSQKASKCDFPTKYNKNFARASGARTYYPPNSRQRLRKIAKFVNFAQEARSKLLTWPPTFECGPQLFRVGGHLGPQLFSPYFQRCTLRYVTLRYVMVLYVMYYAEQ